jgi:hypothetical protein
MDGGTDGSLGEGAKGASSIHRSPCASQGSSICTAISRCVPGRRNQKFVSPRQSCGLTVHHRHSAGRSIIAGVIRIPLLNGVQNQ